MVARMLLTAIVLMPLALFVISLTGRWTMIGELFCSFRAYVLVTLLVFAPLLWLLRRRWINIAYGVAVVWCLFGTAAAYVPASWCGHPSPTTTELASGPTIKLMSYNLLGTNRQYAKAVDQVRKHDPDVLILLEFANEWNVAMSSLHETYPYRIEQPRWHGFGIALYSKTPLRDVRVEAIAKNRTDNPLIQATVDVGGRPLRFAGVHLLSPMTARRFEIRNEQMADVARLLNQSDVPTVLAGDFNCVPWSSHLVRLTGDAGLRDSRQGFGYQASWSAERRWLRIPIDHALVSDRVLVHRRWIGEQSGGSDHYPLLVEMSVR